MNIYYGNDISCVYSDDNSDKLVFRIRVIKFKKSEGDKMNDLNVLKNISQTIREKVVVKGINGITNMSMYKNKNNFDISGHNYEAKEEWVLNTTGTNLVEIMGCSNVDCSRTHSNDIYEMYEMLGIEAARAILLIEIKEVIAENYVNYRHLSLLCDIMTNKGTLMSIDRFGINRGNIGPLAKCSFEETTDQLFKASIFGEMDMLQGVSANIMMGQIPPCGTGDSDIVLDESKFMDVYPEEEIELDDIDDWVKQDSCSDNIGIAINSSAISADNTSNIPMPDIEL
jgi:DNA-directed RNA polymerase II subunit RPB1